jgi:hypothetical protein
MKILNENGTQISNDIEIVEQNLVKKYIQPGDKVLELGARYGAVSITTNKIIKNKEDHYVVEPDKSVWRALQNNMINNGCDFNIIKGIIGKNKYRLEGHGYSKHTVVDSRSQIEIFDLPNINFNSLIVDCEGYFEIFFDENKDLFTSGAGAPKGTAKLNKIIIEADRPEACDYRRVFRELEEMGWNQVEYIKEPTCPNMWHHVFIRKKPNILFCSLSDRPNFSQPIFDKLKEYCHIHNYKYVLEDKVLDTSRAPSWSKIILLKREMLNNKDIDYIVWIDDDILICDKNKKFEDFLNNDFSSLLICNDIAINPFNCGLMVFKNNQESIDMLDEVWEIGNRETKWKKEPNWEQECFKIYYGKDNSKIKIIPHRTMQSIHMTYKPGDFSIHFAGIHNINRRIQMRDQMLKNII